MNIGKQLRLRRVWKHNRAVIIPFDHGQYGGVPKGLEDPKRLTERIANTGADAVLVTPGVLDSVYSSLGDLGVILRIDGGFTKYTPAAGDYEPIFSVEHAVQLGVDAGIVFTFVGTPFDGKSLSRLGRTAEEADRWGLPLIAEVLPPSLLDNHFERNIFKVRSTKKPIVQETLDVCRIASEHGAGILKTRYSGTPEEFNAVIRSSGATVIVAGGPTLGKGDNALLQFAADCVKAGAHGIVFGRNVWQHPKMEQLIAALCAIVHEEESAERAAALLR